MKPEIKIEDLRIGQKIWVDCNPCIIDALSSSINVQSSAPVDNQRIGVCGKAGYYLIEELGDRLRLSQPTKTKRYWQWRVMAPYWYRVDAYLDIEGKDTRGIVHHKDWMNTDRVKDENDFIDVEIKE